MGNYVELGGQSIEFAPIQLLGCTISMVGGVYSATK